MNRVVGFDHLCVPSNRLTRVRINVEAREVGAGYVEANPMTLFEGIRHRRNRDFISAHILNISRQ